MRRLSNGFIVNSNIEILILDYLDEALDFEIKGRLDEIHFPYPSVKQLFEYKTQEEIETLAHYALDYFLFIKQIKIVTSN